MIKDLLIVFATLFLTAGVFYYAYDQHVPPGKTYDVDFFEEVNYKTTEKLRNILKKAKKGDVINININSPGGRVDAGYQTVRLIEKTEATVNMEVHVFAASMVAVWLCYADNLTIHEDAAVMFHTIQQRIGYIQTPVLPNDPRPFTRMLYERFVEKSLQRDCKAFLSNGEYKALTQGENIWIKGDELNDRLKHGGYVLHPGENS